MSRWIVRRTAFAGMAAVAFVLAHNLVFLASYGAGYQDALTRTGHDDAWTTAVLAVLGLGVLLLRLRDLATPPARPARSRIGPPAFRRLGSGDLAVTWAGCGFDSRWSRPSGLLSRRTSSMARPASHCRGSVSSVRVSTRMPSSSWRPRRWAWPWSAPCSVGAGTCSSHGSRLGDNGGADRPRPPGGPRWNRSSASRVPSSAAGSPSGRRQP